MAEPETMLTILICDDEPGMRMAVARSLRNFSIHIREIDQEVGFNVKEADTGETAVDMIMAETPDILLLDYKLPGINGLEVLDRVQSKQNEMLTVMITAYASLDTAVTATKRGAYDFLAKPFTPDELKRIIRKVASNFLLQRQARRLAEEKRKIRFQFISVLTHELKAPLAAIEGYLQIMKQHVAGDKISDYDHVIDRTTIRLEGMQKLIYDLLDMTRLESGQKKRELVETNVVDAAVRALETAEPEAVHRNITITLHDKDPVMMTADTSELDIIFNNLVSNAIKYNRYNGTVDVHIKHDDESVTITVKDTGIGMSKEDTDRLFNDFVRIKNEKTRNILGSGLGLSILKKLSDLYDGSVYVESEPDVGSSFSVVLKKHTPDNTDTEKSEAQTVSEAKT